MGIKVVDNAYKWIRKQCKGDDSLVFVVLLGLGFLLCMIFNREGFENLTDTVSASQKYGFGACVPDSVPGSDDNRNCRKEVSQSNK